MQTKKDTTAQAVINNPKDLIQFLIQNQFVVQPSTDNSVQLLLVMLDKNKKVQHTHMFYQVWALYPAIDVVDVIEICNALKCKDIYMVLLFPERSINSNNTSHRSFDLIPSEKDVRDVLDYRYKLYSHGIHVHDIYNIAIEDPTVFFRYKAREIMEI